MDSANESAGRRRWLLGPEEGWSGRVPLSAIRCKRRLSAPFSIGIAHRAEFTIAYHPVGSLRDFGPRSCT
jgi:hypothetical protein